MSMYRNHSVEFIFYNSYIQTYFLVYNETHKQRCHIGVKCKA